MSTDEETVEWYTPQEVKEGAQNALCIRKRKESNHYLIDYYECYTIHTTVHIELDPTHLMQPAMKKWLSVIDQTGQLRKRGPQHWFLVNNYLKREFIRAKQKTTQLRVNSRNPSLFIVILHHAFSIFHLECMSSMISLKYQERSWIRNYEMDGISMKALCIW